MRLMKPLMWRVGVMEDQMKTYLDRFLKTGSENHKKKKNRER
jgi:hypothetical protein